MRTFWTDKEIKFITENYSDMNTSDIAIILNRPMGGVYGKAHSMGLKKSKEYLAKMLEREAKKLAEFGKNYQFKKGHLPYNYGQKMSTILYEKIERTMFKKGRKPHNTRNEGEESKSKDGYTYVKIGDNDWRLKHRVIWEKVNGPIPDDHIVVFKDNNQLNFDINNLELISKSDNMLRNTIHQYPEPIKEIIKLNNKLKKKINAKQN
jgi:hypothetical protein